MSANCVIINTFPEGYVCFFSNYIYFQCIVLHF